MTLVCDVCGDPIKPPSSAVRFAEGDYHDREECIGALQSAIAAAVEKVKKPKPTGG